MKRPLFFLFFRWELKALIPSLTARASRAAAPVTAITPCSRFCFDIFTASPWLSVIVCLFFFFFLFSLTKQQLGGREICEGRKGRKRQLNKKKFMSRCIYLIFKNCGRPILIICRYRWLLLLKFRWKIGYELLFAHLVRPGWYIFFGRPDCGPIWETNRKIFSFILRFTINRLTPFDQK